MIYDHIKYFENINHKTGDIEVRAIYTVDLSEVIDPSTYEETEKTVIKLTKQIQKEMIKDLSGYFKDESFDEKDVEYITTISHGQLEKMRKLAELTKWMSIDEVEKVIHAYEALTDLATMLK